MPITHSHQFYEVNVLDFGADPTGVLDSTQAFKDAIKFIMDNNYKRLYIPLAQGQIYWISNSIDIEFTDIYIYGDAPLIYLTDYNTRVPNCGYIKSTITTGKPVFNISYYVPKNTPTQYPVGSCTIEGLCFYLPVNANISNTNKKAIRFINADNAPQRNVKVSKCTCFGFDSFIHVVYDKNQTPTPDYHSVVIGFFTMEDCIISGCKTAVLADYSIMGSVFKNNQFLNGTRMKGLFCAETIFKNNVFDSVEDCFTQGDFHFEPPSPPNPDIPAPELNPNSVASPLLMNFERNQLRQISGEYFMRFQGNNADNLICVGDNFSIEQCNVLDLFLLEGTNSFRLLENYNNIKTKVSQGIQRRASVVLNPISIFGNTSNDTSRSVLHFNSSLNEQNFYFIPFNQADSSNKWYAAVCLPYHEYCRGLEDPTSGNIDVNIGSQFANTPYGPTNTAEVITLNSPLNAFVINGLTYGQSIPHCTLVVSILIKFDNISFDEIVHTEFEIKASNGSLIQLIREPEMKYGFNNKWFVLTMMCSNYMPLVTSNSISISISVSDIKTIPTTQCEVTIAGIGAYVVPQSDIDNLIYNSTNNYRVLIRPYIPF